MKRTITPSGHSKTDGMMRCRVTEKWRELATSLESPLARRHLAAALRLQGVLEGAHLGGDLATALAEVPESKLAGSRADAAIAIALDSIGAELDALMRRASVCFGVSIALGVALAAAILWMAISGDITRAKLLVTLASTAGGGGTFAYYKYISNQAVRLRKDLFRISESPLWAGRPSAKATGWAS
jgi:hypothetical protein